MFNRIGGVILLVSDLKKSIKFYNNVLGMELKQRTKDWVEFSRQGTVLALHPVKKKKKMTKNEVLAAIRRWKYVPAMSWEELRKLTREP